MKMIDRGLIAVVAAVVLAISCAAAVAQSGSVLDAAMAAVSASAPDSEAEAQAMSTVIAAVRARPAPPVVSPDIANAVAAAAGRKAATPAEFAALARSIGAASRAAPWMAEYHFLRGGLLAKAGANAAAALAFTLYLEAAPGARDRLEVVNLIASLRRDPPSKDIRAPVRTAGDQFRDCAKCPEMVVVPAGRFVMGSPVRETGRFDSEGPQHAVSVRAFALGKYPVTEEEFTAFLAATAYQPGPCNRLLDKTWRSPGGGIVFPPGQADLPRQPAVCVNWFDVQAYIAWLNASAPLGAGTYRLPSEAEWEYAARAGTTTARGWGEGLGVGNTNCQGCGSQWDNTLIAPVGSFKANAFGLFDVLGNTWQWLADCWNENYEHAPTDGSVWTAGDCRKRVMRGGSWSNLPAFIRSAARSRGDGGGADFDYSSYVGFRLAKPL